MTSEVPIEDQIACLKRELAMRRGVYPRWVQQHKLTQANADKEMARMEAALATLQRIADGWYA